MTNTPPFISEVVELLVTTFQEMTRDEEGTVVPSRRDLDFLREKLTAVYERGRADAVEYLKSHGEEAVTGLWYVTDADFTSALTTEGK